jgi:DNA-binding GntR family transcriptional regulator
MTLMADFLSRRQSNLRFSSRVVKMHEDILQAIVKKNDSEAFVLLEKHLLEVEESLKGFSKRSEIRQELDSH